MKLTAWRTARMKSKTIPETVKILLGALACLALLAACSGKPGPSKSELEAELISGQLPASWSLESLDVTAQENIGTDVEPVIASRFAAEVELQQDLYKQTVTSRPVEAEGGNKVRYLATNALSSKPPKRAPKPNCSASPDPPGAVKAGTFASSSKAGPG
jgi:hypothetical protein